MSIVIRLLLSAVFCFGFFITRLCDKGEEDSVNVETININEWEDYISSSCGQNKEEMKTQ
jgi:hypothetical protein